MKKCGFVAVLGETNSGKSSLINRLVGQKVSITSRKIQTTIARVLGIAIHGDAQIILVDTPGFLRGKNIRALDKIAWGARQDSSEILFVVDCTKKNFENSLNLIQKIDQPVSLVLNKIDLIHKPLLLSIIDYFQKEIKFKNVFLVSAKTGSGVDVILNWLEEVMPECEWIYPEDEFTDLSSEMYAAEITRASIFHLLHKELPYSCVVDPLSYKILSDGSIKIYQNIHVKHKAHRIIVLGAHGQKIKHISQTARLELEKLLGTTVHLFLHVVVDKKGE